MANSDNRKSRGRFNLFDILLILAVLSCIAGVVLHAVFTEKVEQTHTEEARISFMVSGVSPQTADAFCTLNDVIFSQETDEIIGVLVSAEQEALFLDLETADGIIVKAEHPEKKAIRGVSLMTGTWTDDGFLIDGHTLAIVGKTMNVYTEHAVCTITITGVSQ